MIMIFGWTNTARRERPLIDTHCFRCRRVTTWDWFRVTEWITVFFLRTLPIKDRHYLVCSGCHDQMQLTHIEASGIKRLSQLNKTDATVLHDGIIARLEAHQLAEKSVTQREYLRAEIKAKDDTKPDP